MGKNKNNKKMKEPVLPDSDEEMEYQVESDNDDDDRLTLSKLDEISDGEEEDIEEWDAEAKALRQAIADGAFAKLNLKKISPAAAAAITGDAMEEGDDDVEDDNNDDDEDDDERDQDTENESSSDGEDEENAKKVKTQNNSIKALKSITAQLVHQKARLPWPEKFDVVPPNPLPFGQVSEDGLVIDVHDDLKREVAFYNLALEAVYEARQKCEDCNIPFSRPDDFFAEMVKTDDHMAKVKDRLIFETKKIEAFEQRKSNREQKLRQKEAHAHRLAEKSKAKKQHLQDVQDWAKSAASNRVGGGKVRDDDDDYLNRMNSGPSKKRQNFDKKYGFGGKRGRFKQNSSKDLNDMSGFKPKGSFAGGMKATANKRKGKRARDAAKSRK